MAAAAPAGGEWRAIVVGSTGETGKRLVQELLQSSRWSQVTAVTRTQLSAEQLRQKFGAAAVEGASSQKLRQLIVDFERLDDFKGGFAGHTHGFCCLGTTRKKAGSAEAFRHIDLDYTIGAARLMKEGGVHHFSLLTSQGANAGSMFLYMEVKGKAEEECKKFGFERYSIFRPGMLLVEREESRFWERLFQKIVPGGIRIDHVAKAMALNAERAPSSAVEIFENSAIKAMVQA